MGGLFSLCWLSQSPCVCVADPPADRVESLRNPGPSLSSRSLSLSPFRVSLPFLSFHPRVRVIDRSFLFDGWGRQEERQSLSFGNRWITHAYPPYATTGHNTRRKEEPGEWAIRTKWNPPFASSDSIPMAEKKDEKRKKNGVVNCVRRFPSATLGDALKR